MSNKELLKTRLLNFEEEVEGCNKSIHLIKEKIRKRSEELIHEIDFNGMIKLCKELELQRERSDFLYDLQYNLDFVVINQDIKARYFKGV